MSIGRSSNDPTLDRHLMGRRSSLTMPPSTGDARLDEITVKWRDLADRRLAYFTELYRSGRWKHYYTKESFESRMRDVIKAAKAWRELADRTFATRILTEQQVVRERRPRRAA
jgi:hypothetical protein